MFKKLILSFVLVGIWVSSAIAVDFNWSNDYSMKDNINVIYGSDQTNASAGVFIGTIGEISLELSSKKLVGLGGVSTHISDDGKFLFTLVPITLFDDVVQLGISAKPDNFRWNNPDDYLFSVGFSASGLINKLGK